MGETFEARGHNGMLVVTDTHVTIRRKGALSFMTQGLRGDNEIRLSEVSAVRVKQPGLLTNGYISLTFRGGGQYKGGVFNATKDENTVMFTKKQARDFARAAQLIRERSSG